MNREVLEDIVGAERQERMRRVLDARTRLLTVLVEDIFDPHNAAACLRSSEGFGLQDVHVVEREYPFSPARRVVLGTDKWLDIHRHETATTAVERLRADGYKIYATDLSATTTIDAIDFTQPVCLAFGNEHAGISSELRDVADGTFIIPMRGFVQSFNISVALAVALYHATLRRLEQLGDAGDLPDERKGELWGRWLRQSVPNGDAIEAEIKRRAREQGIEPGAPDRS